MIPSISQPASLRWTYRAYILLFYIFLIAPLAVVATFAFNDSLFPSLPWNGFTLDWFTSDTPQRLGVFSDSAMLESVGVSAFIAFWVTTLSIFVATTNAFLFEHYDFRFKEFLYMLMLLPLVIPGVILGISILISSNSMANYMDEVFNLEVEFLRPGLVLVILGQFAFITTIATMVIGARLRKMDRSLEEAAYNLGATKTSVLRTITLPYLRPAMIGAGIVAFLMSFENFNTTLMLTSSDSPLTITMFDRLREGSTPELNAVSLLLMIVSGVLALISVFVQKKEDS
ncbi:ABC transporter permease [Cocleimonas sp. KMM 6892]|uniref:ABC transporter permease n=1 Tax=unclassified Cocleimonas TaxID=2639732 RepID=UPI002DBD521B|nr:MULTISPECIES: ABC transporter permease [unclassified Cocleimonas]MEB8431110.1 ABC transporter permease [Cocleimonas sp. KMM 6892]MEC4714118.1 ABC transporter permease [Cocleimonas sp. KMM 6895]MEC4743449.1 ABC transporter permease [Cocleimonas sp. KMM 6896]